MDPRRAAGKLQIKTIDDKIAEFQTNEKIGSPEVKLKNADGTLSDSQSLDQLILSLDPSNQYVVQINKADDGEVPVVQVVTRTELVQRIIRLEDQQRNQKRQEKDKRPKQLELNWAIGANDLQMKMKQMHDFLQKGKKVELLLANKRNQRRASEEEARALLKTIREKIDESDATESVPMEGGLLRQSLLTIKRRGT